MPTVTEIDVPVVQEASIVADGRADEPAWAQAVTLPSMVTFAPTFGAVPGGTATVRVLSDSRAIYVHFDVDDPQPERVRANFGRRDTRFPDDLVGIYLDPAGEAQRAYLFAANPFGVQIDGTNVSGANEDVAWDGRWASAGRRTEDGYEVEFAIPWRSVRHPARAEKIGLWTYRQEARSGEKSSWPALDPNVGGLLVQEAIVGGPGELGGSRHLDVIPELTFGWTETGPSTGRIGGYGFAPGLTARWEPDPAVELLGTINPDFSQVESDASQIDLNRRYALFYQEKRPFFVQGQEWFSTPFDGLVYTRSMTAPVYGARVTAESNGWTVSGLHVLDALPAPSISEGGGWTEADLAGHTSLDTVVRARRAVGADAYVGAVLSDRSILGTDLANRLGGLDARARLSERWSLSGAALASATTFKDGSSGIAPAGIAQLTYRSKVVSGNTWVDLTGPGFRAENGFVPQADQVGGGGTLAFDIYPKSKVIPAINAYPIQLMLYRFTDGTPRLAAYDPAVGVTFGNGSSVWLSGHVRGEAFAGKWLPSERGVLEVEGQWTRWFRASGGFATGTAPYYDPAAPSTGWQDQAWASMTLSPVARLSASASTTWERFSSDGEPVYEGLVARVRVEAWATRRLWMRVIGDTSTFDGHWDDEALIAWEHSPGTALYLGASRTGPTPLPKAAGAEQWQVFAKGSVVL